MRIQFKSPAGHLHLAFTIGVSILLGGCGMNPEPTSSPPERSPDHAKALERQIEELRKIHERQAQETIKAITRQQNEEIEAIRARSDRERADLEQEISTLKKKIAEKDREVARLKGAVEIRNESRSRIPPSIVPPAITHFQRPQGGDPGMDTAAGITRNDTFPIRIIEVSGKKVVVGKHSSIRWVETDEEEKDGYGNLRKVLKKENFTVNDYDYQVGFTATNRTESAQVVQYRAGKKWASAQLHPAQRRQLMVDSAMGASLIISVGKDSRSYPVSYK